MQTVDWSSSMTSMRKWIPEEHDVVISKRTVLRKKHRVIKYWDVPPSSRSARPVRGPWAHRNVIARGSGSGIINLQHLGWVTRAPLGKQLSGVQKRALRSALSAIGRSGPVNCSAHRIRAQDLAWKAGFNFWRERVHQEKNPDSSAYSIYLCISSSFLQTAFSCFRKSCSLQIPFHFTWS